MNPFHHGVVVSGANFCPRPKLLNDLRGHLASRQNCVIRGGRRMGKTSAVMEAVRQEKEVGCLMVNCWGKSSPRALAEAISGAFLTLQSRRGVSLSGILERFARLRPQVSVDPLTGQPSFSVDLSTVRDPLPASLERAMEPLGEEGRDKRLLVVFDEFQALLRMPEHEDVVATLRGIIQMQAEVTYFYLGRLRNEMDALFNNPAGPFFKSAAGLTVGPIPREVFGEFLGARFASGKRRILPEALESIFRLCDDIAGDVQQLCSQAWSATSPGDVIDGGTVARSLARIHEIERESNMRIVDLLTPGQVRVLAGLARHGGAQPTSKAFLMASGIGQASSVTKALRRLESEGLVYRESGSYQFFSPFFKTWLIAEGPGA